VDVQLHSVAGNLGKSRCLNILHPHFHVSNLVMPSSHRGSHKSRGVGSAVVRFFGISGVIVLGGYGAFVVLVEHCRSMSAPGTSDYLEDFASQTQVRSLQNGRSEHHESTGCKLAQVISSRKALGPDAKLGATFLIGGDSILHTAEIGLQIVTVDPLTQVTTKRQLYKPWETSDAAVMEQDLAALPTGYVVLASLQGASEDTGSVAPAGGDSPTSGLEC